MNFFEKGASSSKKMYRIDFYHMCRLSESADELGLSKAAGNSVGGCEPRKE